MGLNRDVLMRQLQQAQASLAACEKELLAAGVAKHELRFHPAWRREYAAFRQIRRRQLSAEALRNRRPAPEETD